MDYDGITGNNRKFRGYKYYGHTGETITIDLRSSEFDACLTILDGEKNTIRLSQTKKPKGSHQRHEERKDLLY